MGKIPILTNIFQMGWNHQPDDDDDDDDDDDENPKVGLGWSTHGNDKWHLNLNHSKVLVQKTECGNAELPKHQVIR